VRRTLPPLNALRAFDAAGRLLSFARAAEELYVTPGAVSRHIRELEKRLGTQLFVRLTRRIELTEAGRSYLQEIQVSFDRLEQATIIATSARTLRVLTISVLPSIASYWLMPRLAAFTRMHPNIETRIITSIQPFDLADADLAIRVGSPPGRRADGRQPRIELKMVADWEGVRADFLFPDALVPLCSPALLRDKLPLKAPADLRHYPLIHTSTRAHAWSDWFRAHGADMPIRRDATQYGHFFMSIQAAREAQGVAIAPHLFFLGAGAEGLVFPFRSPIRSGGDYYLLTPESRSLEPEIQLFRNWLTELASEQRESDPFFKEGSATGNHSERMEAAIDSRA
jgi:LysR family glycine cleavage system transcriptional activator